MLQEGVLLAWRSADPLVQVQEVGGALAGRTVVSIAAGAPRSLPGACMRAWAVRSSCLGATLRRQRAGAVRLLKARPKRVQSGPTPPHPCCINPLQASTGRRAVTAEGDVYMFAGVVQATGCGLRRRSRTSRRHCSACCRCRRRHHQLFFGTDAIAVHAWRIAPRLLQRQCAPECRGSHPQPSRAACHLCLHWQNLRVLVSPTHRSSIDSDLRGRKNRTKTTLAHARQGVCDLVVTSFACTCCYRHMHARPTPAALIFMCPVLAVSVLVCEILTVFAWGV